MSNRRPTFKQLLSAVALALILAALIDAGCGCAGRLSSQYPRKDGWRFNWRYDQWEQVNEFGVVTNVQPTINKVIRDNQ